MEAVYFVTPSSETIQLIIEDFTRNRYNRDGHLYACAHLFFTSALDDRLFHKLKSSQAFPFVKTLREVYLDFLALETQCFILERPASLITFYGSEVPGEVMNKEYIAIARQIASFCITLGEFPFIRYSCINGVDRITSRVAALVYEELDRYAKAEPDFPSSDSLTLGPNRAVLVITDRMIDPMAPLLHEFTYQAMANDLLPLTNNGTRYTMSTTTADTKSNVVILDELLDPLWTSVRHTHIASAIDNIISTFNKFLTENRAAAGLTGSGVGGGGVRSLNELRDTLSAMPQFQNLKAKFTSHINISSECMALFNKNKMTEIAIVEQDLATGETADGSKPKHIEIEMVPLLDSDSISTHDKVRLLMLYIIAKEGVKDEDRKKLLEHAKISSEEVNAITNLSLLGVKLSHAGTKTKVTKRDKKVDKRRADGEVSYDVSRYVPALKNHLQDLSEGLMTKDMFPFVKEPNSPGTYGSMNVKKGGSSNVSDSSSLAPPIVATSGPTSLRSTKPSWHNKKATGSDTTSSIMSTPQDRNNISAAEDRRRAGRVICFIVGGVTYSEIRSVYELSTSLKKDFIVGSTHAIIPNEYVNDLKKLRQPYQVVEAAIKSQTNLAHTSSGNLANSKESFGSQGGLKKNFKSIFKFGKSKE